MTTAKVTSKGQITIPAAIRSALKVGPGDRVEFVRTADNRFEVLTATQEVTKMRGMIKGSRKVSVKEMNETVRARAGRPFFSF